jgi:hypothetical protein
MLSLCLFSSLTAVIVAIGFAFMPANFISFAVKEEQDKVKHQQLISGVSALSYWGANYVWDFCNYMVSLQTHACNWRKWDTNKLSNFCNIDAMLSPRCR